MRIGFRQINPTGGKPAGTYNDGGDPTGAPVKIVAWDAVSWTAWKHNAALSARRFWNERFWLLNNLGTCPFKTPANTFIPNFTCGFELIANDASVGFNHHVVDVVRLDPSEAIFNSHATLMDSLDASSVVNGTDSAGKAITQVPIAHEIGHLIAFGHVDIGKPHCPATSDTNAAVCYGVSDYDMNSVMGRGMQLRSIHAMPWIISLDIITKALPASTLYVPQAKFVKPIEAYQQIMHPRTVQEFETGVLPTGLPVGR